MNFANKIQSEDIYRFVFDTLTHPVRLFFLLILICVFAQVGNNKTDIKPPKCENLVDSKPVKLIVIRKKKSNKKINIKKKIA